MVALISRYGPTASCRNSAADIPRMALLIAWVMLQVKSSLIVIFICLIASVTHHFDEMTVRKVRIAHNRFTLSGELNVPPQSTWCGLGDLYT